MSSTKDELIYNIKEWISIDNEINTFQKEIKQRKERKKLLNNKLISIMKTNDIDCFDINNGKIVYTRNKVRSPINKKHLLDCLSKHFSNSTQESIEELTKFILESREVKMTDKIQYKVPK
jgi:diadenosine tetraphosphate (Ap4A) HIT family hydrolase